MMTKLDERALFDDVTAGSTSAADVEKLRAKYAVQARLFGEAEGRVERTRDRKSVV